MLDRYSQHTRFCPSCSRVRAGACAVPQHGRASRVAQARVSMSSSGSHKVEMAILACKMSYSVECEVLLRACGMLSVAALDAPSSSSSSSSSCALDPTAKAACNCGRTFMTILHPSSHYSLRPGAGGVPRAARGRGRSGRRVPARPRGGVGRRRRADSKNAGGPDCGRCAGGGVLRVVWALGADLHLCRLGPPEQPLREMTGVNEALVDACVLPWLVCMV